MVPASNAVPRRRNRFGWDRRPRWRWQRSGSPRRSGSTRRRRCSVRTGASSPARDRAIVIAGSYRGRPVKTYLAHTGFLGQPPTVVREIDVIGMHLRREPGCWWGPSATCPTRPLPRFRRPPASACGRGRVREASPSGGSGPRRLRRSATARTSTAHPGGSAGGGGSRSSSSCSTSRLRTAATSTARADVCDRVNAGRVSAAHLIVLAARH
jgi:hypothetical protein